MTIKDTTDFPGNQIQALLSSAEDPKSTTIVADGLSSQRMSFMPLVPYCH